MMLFPPFSEASAQSSGRGDSTDEYARLHGAWRRASGYKYKLFTAPIVEQALSQTEGGIDLFDLSIHV